ncbi:serine/threonine-protein kinase [Undibacterium sp.]|jgi:serine/threonine protein kinase|uniref:serine/threonine-protein kinase n=1 Tax=Undibacterium sp. TaxID=1914977 RepID=UPI002C754889|nr:serine/threonine-protein kinase [Undibacterium sp.]HTD04601.1 serine/threonine-protein kinase [Undibacterium sp.]
MPTPSPDQDNRLTHPDLPQSDPAAAHAGSENCLPVGARLGDFEITGVIGEGGFGIVYLAFDHSLQRIVAIKEYMPVALAGRGPDDSVVIRSVKHTEAFSTGLESYINEARLLAQFDHPSLVKVYRFWKQNKTAYMAMQYYEGHTLKYIAEHHPELIGEAWLTNLLRSIVGALETLYSAHILHRDISPENIMIQRSGVPVLLDFGAARQVIGGTPQDLTVILKPSFAPVEQYADDANLIQGQWSDIYALCAVVYSAIVKKSPPSSVTRMIKDPMQRLQDLAPPGYSPAFLAAIDQGLNVLPDFRPQSTAEFRALLGLEAAPSLPPQPHAKLPPQFTTHAAPASRPAGTTALPEEQPIPAAPATAKTFSASAKKTGAAKAGASAAVTPHKPGRRWYYALAGGVVMIVVVGAWSWSGGKPATVATETANTAATVAPADASPPPMPALPAGPAPDVASAAASTAAQITATLDQNETVLADGASNSSKTEAPAPMTLVTLNIKPWGTLYINGAHKGVSPPLKRLQLPPGKYQVKIVNPNFPDFQTELQLTSKKAVALAHDFSSQGGTP